MPSLFLFGVLLVLLYHGRHVDSQKCYNTDGSVMTGDLPCNTDLEHSFCCGASWTCLSRGICSDLNTTQSAINGSPIPALQRATCTDRTWYSGECPQFCLNDKDSRQPLPISHYRKLMYQRQGQGKRDRGLYQCDGNYSSFCCARTPCWIDSNKTCLTNKRGFVSFSQDNVPVTTIGRLGPKSTSPVTSAQSPSSATNAVSPTFGVVRTVTVGSGTTSTPPSAASTTAAGDPQHSSSSKSSATIGIAVGVSIGVIVPTMGLLLSLWRRRRKQKAASSATVTQKPHLLSSSLKSQDNPADISRMGYPPGELYEGDKYFRRAEMAGATSSPRSRYELWTAVDPVSELAQDRDR